MELTLKQLKEGREELVQSLLVTIANGHEVEASFIAGSITTFDQWIEHEEQKEEMNNEDSI